MKREELLENRKVEFSFVDATLSGSMYNLYLDCTNMEKPCIPIFKDNESKLSFGAYVKGSQVAKGIKDKNLNFLKQELKSNKSYNFGNYFVISGKGVAVFHKEGETSDEFSEFSQPVESDGFYYYFSEVKVEPLQDYESKEDGLIVLAKEIKKRVNMRENLRVQIQLGLLDTL